MKVRTLELRNFRRFREARWELPDGVSAILGPNGAGKSTLLEAITFALYGNDALRTGKDLLRHSDAAPADAVQVAIDLEATGQALRIVRELKGKNLTPSATLTIDGALLVSGGAGSDAAVTHELTKRLGLDLKGFVSTVVARQGELRRLASETPVERKRMLLSLMGVDRIDGAIQEGRERRRAAEAAVNALRGDLPDAAMLEAATKQAKAEHEVLQAAAAVAATTAEAAQKAMAAARTALEAAQQASAARRQILAAKDAAQAQVTVQTTLLIDAERQLAEARAAAEAAQRLAELAGQAKPRRQVASDARLAAAQAKLLESRRAELARLDALLATPAVAFNDDRAVLTQRRDAVRTALADLQERAAVATSERDAAKRHLEQLAQLGDAATCPVCKRSLEDHRATLASDLEATAADATGRLAALDKRIVAARQEVAAADATLRAAEAAAQQHALREAQRARDGQQAAAIRAELAAAPPALPAADIDALERSAKEAEHAALKLASLAEQATREPALAQRATATRAALTAAQQAKAVAEQDPSLALPDPLPPAMLAHDAATRSERGSALASAEARHAAAAGEARVGEAVRRQQDAAARREGLARHEVELRAWTMLAGRDGLLERFRDHVVARIGPVLGREAGRLLSAFTDGRYDEVVLDGDYRLFVGDGGVHLPIERFSGGEQDLCYLAVRLAVSRVLAERSGSDLRFLALDEVFGSLDRERRDLVVAALGSLDGLYSQVLVISHLEGLREALGNAVEVVGDGNEATLRIPNA